MDVRTQDEVRAVIDKATATFARRYPWVERAELAQVAWVTALDALRRYDPAKGQLEPYVWSVVRARMGSHLARTRSPVSLGSESNCKRSGEFVRVRLDGVLLADGVVRADDALDRARWEERARAAVRETIGGMQNGTREAALRLLAGVTPAQAARARGVSVAPLYWAGDRARAKLRESKALRALWAERP